MNSNEIKEIFDALRNSNDASHIEKLILLKQREESNLLKCKKRIVIRKRRRVISVVSSVAAACLAVCILVYTQSPYKINRQFIENKQALTIVADSVSDVLLMLSDGHCINLDKQDTINDAGILIANNHQEGISYKKADVAGDITLLNTLIVPKGKKSKLTLQDGTVVTINSNSKITYPTKFNEKTREVTLEGEAYFEVIKDESKPFIVKSNALKIEVLGTSFNVKSYLEELNKNVTLASGSVAVMFSERDDEKSILTPGKMLVYNNISKETEIKEVVVSDVLAWMDGKIVFINEDIKDITRKISRHYNVTIRCEVVEPMLFYYKTSKFDSVEDVLNLLQMCKDIVYTKDEDGGYTIKQK